MGQLRNTNPVRPLLIIYSDIRIKQCIHYRIHQKINYLRSIGLAAMHFSPENHGRMWSFLGLAHTVIIYRMAVSPDVLQAFRQSNVRVLFEVDDLVIGANVLEQSGILSQVGERVALGLRETARGFLTTAQACDGLIFSTPYLAQVYADPENGLASKPREVIPNFAETDDYADPVATSFTFAYTSPSGSVSREFAQVSALLSAYDRAATESWSILVMGNPFVRDELKKISFRHGKIHFEPFKDYADYIQSISRCGLVLIPLDDNPFNRSKTVIRLIDAALAGTLPLFSPVGAYGDFAEALGVPELCIGQDAWAKQAAHIPTLLAKRARYIESVQSKARELYGPEAAAQCYRRAFLVTQQSAPRAMSRNLLS